MDRQQSLRLQHAQRIAQRRHRHADQLDQVVLRHEGAGRQFPPEQHVEDPLISDLAQRHRDGFDVAFGWLGGAGGLRCNRI